MERLLTPKEVCEMIGIKLSTLYQWSSKNTIPHLKPGGLLRFERQHLEEWKRNKLVQTRTKLLE